jgi:insertion element IS1 protein InsB
MRVNRNFLEWLKPEQVEVDIVRVEEPEASGVEESQLDEMWSYVGKKTNPRWRAACD